MQLIKLSVERGQNRRFIEAELDDETVDDRREYIRKYGERIGNCLRDGAVVGQYERDPENGEWYFYLRDGGRIQETPWWLEKGDWKSDSAKLVEVQWRGEWVSVDVAAPTDPKRLPWTPEQHAAAQTLRVLYAACDPNGWDARRLDLAV